MICPVNRAIFEWALASSIADFEDAVQIACAVTEGLDAILTRDTQDFANSTIPILSVPQLLEQLEQTES